jgi:hypothetical protein
VENLRELRLALDVIGMFYPENARSDAVNVALDDVHDHLCAEEDLALRESGVLDRYLIIRPVNPLSPPPRRTCSGSALLSAPWRSSACSPGAAMTANSGGTSDYRIGFQNGA